jgi:hypothetical protein
MIGIDYTHPTLTSNVFDDVVFYLLPWVREDFPFYTIFILIRFLIMEEEFLLGINGFLPFFSQGMPKDKLETLMMEA